MVYELNKYKEEHSVLSQLSQPEVSSTQQTKITSVQMQLLIKYKVILIFIYINYGIIIRLM